MYQGMQMGVSMIKSMTGFGRYESVLNGRKFTVEMKAVNHRYLDVNIKMPKALNFFESAIRSELKNHISRGKVDVYVSYEDTAQQTNAVRYNRDIAAEYVQYMRQMAEEFGLEDNIRMSTLAKLPEVFVLEENGQDKEELWKELLMAVEGAAAMFVESRIAEGERLREDLFEKLDGMLGLVDRVEERYPQVVTEYRRKLEERTRELLGGAAVDENRLLAEVVLFADKACVDEEVVRLRSHLEATRKTLMEGGSVGRKLDFIAQEMNREANTILSKANDLALSDYAIDLKTEIEKVREQIQNIE